MAGLFGSEETLECIQPVGLKSSDGQDLCIGYRTETFFVGMGVGVRDKGYILKGPKWTSQFYPLPSGEELSRLQAEGLLPSPLPPYSIAPLQLVMGYSLWLALLAIVIFAAGRRFAWRRRQQKEASIEIRGGPPRLLTEGDNFIAEAVRSQLLPQEEVLHQAYVTGCSAGWGFTGALDRAWFAVLTSQRLLLFPTDLFTFSPTLRVGEVESIPRDDIHSAFEADSLVSFVRKDGATRPLMVLTSERHFSNQLSFRRDVPRILAPKTIT